MNTIFDLADWFLSKESMTPKKLQKLCYYAYAWGLALLEKEIADTYFEAWVHGPVNPDLYQKYRNNGWKEIPVTAFCPNLTEDEESVLEAVYATYGDLTGDQLERLTHQEKPWMIAREDYKPWEICTNQIDPDSMQEYYKQIYAASQND